MGEHTAKYQMKPLMAGRGWTWLKAMFLYGPPEFRYIPRAALLVLSGGSSILARISEHIRFDKAIERTSVHNPPLFILGFMRSGTTLLHNLLCQDPRFGYLASFQVGAPQWYISGEKNMRWLTNLSLPTQRPMDPMPLRADSPQEDEFAVLNMSEQSAYFGLFFPKRARELIPKYALMQNMTKKDLNRWKKTYLYIIKKATLYYTGKPLVLKNPLNMARVPRLLELFPNARFVHICRNPYDILPSAIHTLDTLTQGIRLQSVTHGKIRDWVFDYYRLLMAKYIEDRNRIPAGNLTQLRFEDLERDPLGEIRRLYSTLALGNFETVRPALERHLCGIGHYRKNKFALSPQDIADINHHWRFAFEEFGYPLRQV
jgi:hypothetical protein